MAGSHLLSNAPRRAGNAARQPAVFIDKDGTLIDNVPYNVDPARLSFKPGALVALAALHHAGFALVVVTNQSGIAAGRFTHAQFARLRRALCERIAREAGVRLTAFMVCPHDAAADGTPTCDCRKPLPGMLLRAASRHRLDLAASWMVGDILDDIEAGHLAGCRGLLLDTGGETEWRHGALRRPVAVVTEWSEAAEIMLVERLASLRAPQRLRPMR